MKALILAMAMVFGSSTFAADTPKKDETPAVQNDNCVKKDKNGKCPPPPKSPKPTPKKKAEEKK